MKKQYPSDVSDKEWAILEGMVPNPGGGRPRKYPMRAIINAIRYVLRSGCSWRMLPHDFPPYQSVYYYFRTWREDGSWEKIYQMLYEMLRQQQGKEASPWLGALDSQSVKTTEKRGLKGQDGYKKLTGRKRHLLVDSQGLLLEVHLTAANVSDRRPVLALLQAAQQHYPRLGKVVADKGYHGSLTATVMNRLGIRLTIEQRSQFAKPNQVLSVRWVVERAFAWLGRYRRLSKDYEFLTHSSRAFIFAAMSSLVLRRLSLF